MDVLDYNGLAHFHAKEVDAYNKGYPDKSEYAFVDKRFKRVLDRFDGKNWTTEDETSTAASVPVPTGAKMVDISTIGGASVKADVAKIVSKGKNLFGGSALRQKCADAGMSGTDNESFQLDRKNGFIFYNAFKPNTQYTFIFKGYKGGSSHNANLRLIYDDGTTTEIYSYVGTTPATVSTVSAEGKTLVSLSGASNVTSGNIIYPDGCGLFEGVVTVSEFKSYIGSIGTLTIPSAIRQLQGYGEANSTDINTVDFDSMVFHKKGYYNGTWVADVQDIDISAYPVETMLPVEAGGSIDFEKEDDTTVAVPVSLTFAVDLNDY